MKGVQGTKPPVVVGGVVASKPRALAMNFSSWLVPAALLFKARGICTLSLCFSWSVHCGTEAEYHEAL